MKFGDIVLVTHPTTDYASTKVRPALIISSEKYNIRESDRILLPISSNITRICQDDIVIKDSDKSFTKTGLKISSAIRAGKIFTVEKNVIKRKLGYLPDEIMKQVQNKIKEILNL